MLCFSSVLHAASNESPTKKSSGSLGSCFIGQPTLVNQVIYRIIATRERFDALRRQPTRASKWSCNQCCAVLRCAAMEIFIRLLITAAAAAALRPLIIFGRPGAGKSTIAERLIAHPDANAYNVDLDVCVPQWMRDNFAKGVYPTLAERQAFASDAADYVVTASEGKDACCVVSFFLRERRPARLVSRTLPRRDVGARRCVGRPRRRTNRVARWALLRPAAGEGRRRVALRARFI